MTMSRIKSNSMHLAVRFKLSIYSRITDVLNVLLIVTEHILLVLREIEKITLGRNWFEKELKFLLILFLFYEFVNYSMMAHSLTQ